MTIHKDLPSIEEINARKRQSARRGASVSPKKAADPIVPNDNSAAFEIVFRILGAHTEKERRKVEKRLTSMLQDYELNKRKYERYDGAADAKWMSDVKTAASGLASLLEKPPQLAVMSHWVSRNYYIKRLLADGQRDPAPLIADLWTIASRADPKKLFRPHKSKNVPLDTLISEMVGYYRLRTGKAFELRDQSGVEYSGDGWLLARAVVDLADESSMSDPALGSAIRRYLKMQPKVTCPETQSKNENLNTS